MKTTNKKFKAAYEFCKRITEGTLLLRLPNGQPGDPIVVRGSSLAYAAKRFCEKNENHYVKLINRIRDKAMELCLDDDKGEALTKENNRGIMEYRFNKENQKEYDKYFEALDNEGLELGEEDVHLCPPEKLPANVPFELEPLNGFILDHKFWDEF